MYARRLTKEDLINSGITLVTEDGHVFREEKEVIPNINQNGYFMHFIYELDDLGNRIQVPSEKSVFGYVYKMRSIGLHRLMWAWFHDEVPAGFVVDHINNEHKTLEDYHLSNLQLLTPGQNIAKERNSAAWLRYELPCKLNKPRSFYEDKLNMYVADYEKAKADGDAKLAHNRRSNISQCKARLRYYDAHIAEFQKEAENKDEDVRRAYKHNRAAQIRQFKEELKILHERFNEAQKTYGPGHELTNEARAKWKRGIQISSDWIAAHPALNITEA